jgi:predicted nuclease of predicted toxin-antitoxin system
MKILIDECVPRRFKFTLIGSGRECSTVAEAGFAGKKNGELLRLAEPAFDVFVTVDQGFKHQQNLAGRKIAVVVIHALSNRFVDVEPHAPACIEAFGSIQSGQIIRIGD